MRLCVRVNGDGKEIMSRWLVIILISEWLKEGERETKIYMGERERAI